MRALTVAVTYLLLMPLPAISLWLSFLNNKALHIVGLFFGGVSALLSFAGIFSLVSDLLEDRSYGGNLNEIALSVTLLILSLGVFIIVTAFGILRNYLYAFYYESSD